MAARDVGHEPIVLTRAELDISDREAVEQACIEHYPGAVVNCAAWTNVDGAEEHLDEAKDVNGRGAGNVAAAAAAVGAGVVYPSTDYVFDGSKEAGYVESDRVGPLSAYGMSKLAGERETAAANERHWIVRSSWLFGVNGRNFVETMLGLAQDREEVIVVRDQIGCPTYTGTSPRASCGCSTARTTACTTWRARGAVRGTTSRWRSSARPGSTAACCR